MYVIFLKYEACTSFGAPCFLSVTDLQRDRHAAAVGDDLADAHRHRLLQEQAHLPDSAQHLQDQGHVHILHSTLILEQCQTMWYFIEDSVSIVAYFNTLYPLKHQRPCPKYFFVLYIL